MIKPNRKRETKSKAMTQGDEIECNDIGKWKRNWNWK